MPSLEETAALELTLQEDVFHHVRSHLNESHFPSASCRALVRVIKDRNIVNGKIPDQRILISHLSDYATLTPVEKRQVASILHGATKNENIEPEEGVRSVLNYIRNHLLRQAAVAVAEGNYKRADSLFSKSKDVYADGVASVSEFMNPSSKEELMEMMERDLPPSGSSIRSSSEIINSKLLFGGYKPSDLVMICAAPKVGKTTFMTQEGATALEQGSRVLHLSIGDMSPYDSAVKYMASLTKTDIREVMRDPEPFRIRCEDQLSNLRTRSFPALSVGASELRAIVGRYHDDFSFDLLVVDYDANISSSSDSMYEAGGHLYSSLKGVAEERRCVVMVGSQPKQPNWMDEPLHGHAAAESSRKQQAVDIMITLARNKDCPIVGTLFIPLVRRGESGKGRRVRFCNERAAIEEIDKEEYERVKATSSGDVSSMEEYV